MGWADDDVPDFVTDALDGLSDLGQVSLSDALFHLLKHCSGISHLLTPSSTTSPSRAVTKKPTEIEAEDEGYDSDMTDADQDELFGLSSAKSSSSREIKAALHRDFKAIVEAGWRPGYVDAFVGHVLTISVPINSLDIPARSLECVSPRSSEVAADLDGAQRLGPQAH
jgi:hypothetical protein